jgi:hypothetical protein
MAGGGHQRIKILRGMAIDNVAVPVRFPAFDQREIAGNGLFKDVVLTGKLAHLFAFRDRGAIAGGGKTGDTGAAGADFFRQRALRRSSTSSSPLSTCCSKARFRRRKRPPLCVPGAFPAGCRGRNRRRRSCWIPPSAPARDGVDLGNQVFGNAAQAKAARQHVMPSVNPSSAAS